MWVRGALHKSLASARDLVFHGYSTACAIIFCWFGGGDLLQLKGQDRSGSNTFLPSCPNEISGFFV